LDADAQKSVGGTNSSRNGFVNGLLEHCLLCITPTRSNFALAKIKLSSTTVCYSPKGPRDDSNSRLTLCPGFPSLFPSGFLVLGLTITHYLAHWFSGPFGKRSKKQERKALALLNQRVTAAEHPPFAISMVFRKCLDSLRIRIARNDYALPCNCKAVMTLLSDERSRIQEIQILERFAP
jgi:hypothetical protein